MNQKLISKINNYLLTQPIEKAWIFGSYARSEESKESDLDILVDFSPNSNITLFKYTHIVNELQLLTGKKIDLVENGQLKDFAQESAGKEKILIYERKTQE
jgi:predicted nucleotidyltransferase